MDVGCGGEMLSVLRQCGFKKVWALRFVGLALRSSEAADVSL